MRSRVHILNDDKVIDIEDYTVDLGEHFNAMPKIASPLVDNAKILLSEIEQMLYSAPGFINSIKSLIPKEALQAVLTDEQKSKLANGTLKLMTKKDGSLLASLVNPETKKVVSNIPLEKVKLSPELMQSLTNYMTQMQLAQIAEQIQLVQAAIEEVRQGQEMDRLATAYSCQQKLLQAMNIQNPALKNTALLKIAQDAEDSRNLLMQSQNANVKYVMSLPRDTWGKIFAKNQTNKTDRRINEIRESLGAVNMVSLVEAMAYQELGETLAAQQSLQYYADYIKKTYLAKRGLIERLDMLDPSPRNYWTKTLPELEKQIKALPCNNELFLIEGTNNENKKE